MNLIARAILTLALTVAAGAQAAPDPCIAALEHGLRSAVVFEGDPSWTLQERMEHYGVPSVAIAVIKDYQVTWFKTWGLADRDTHEAATNATLFQAGSISKPVSAFGALRMVEAGQLSLDDDVNLVLKSWSLPDNEFTAKTKVNLKQLLSHTGGLTVHGFLGYAPGLPVPTLVQVLDGVAPANSDPIRVDKTPGGDFRYSGGGYTIAQQMMIDASGKPFPALMDELLLEPAKMAHSTFQQPLPSHLLQHAAAGVLPDGRSVPGKRHTYPEMAAAGLWATAEDLALFAIELQKALQGKSALMSQPMAQTMVTPVDGRYALGLGISKRGDASYFGHGGWDEGFSAELVASLEGGYGVAVMTNSNHPAFIKEVIQGVGQIYSWEGYEDRQKFNVPDPLLIQAPGRYRYDSRVAIHVYAEEGRLFMRYTGASPQELFYIGDGRFIRRERLTQITFTGSGNERLFNFVMGDELQPQALLADNEQLPGEVLENQGLMAGIAAYQKALEANPEENDLSEDTINDNGMDLVKTNPDFAISLLLVNTALYPDSANTWDSVGYAYRQTGNLGKAREYYQAALQRDPELASARAALKEMSAE
jgi:CubicO group peptidase (beta-lactamase class C family)